MKIRQRKNAFEIQEINIKAFWKADDLLEKTYELHQFAKFSNK